MSSVFDKDVARAAKRGLTAKGDPALANYLLALDAPFQLLYEQITGAIPIGLACKPEDLEAALVLRKIDQLQPKPEDGFALRVESIDASLRNTTYKAAGIKLWKSLEMKDVKAYNTVEEYNQLAETANLVSLPSLDPGEES